MLPTVDKAIVASALVKSYPGVHALRGVDFNVASGEVRALLGKNGAGKSTLVRILSGAATPDSGSLRVGGEAVTMFTPSQAMTMGVATVHQELSLVPGLSVAENMLLGRWAAHRKGPLIDRRSIHRVAAAVLVEFGIPLDPGAMVSKLSIAQQQLVEIARGLSARPSVLILDEPTSSLCASEVSMLLQMVGRLAARGVAVVYVSHRMDEIQQVAHSVTVLRDGGHVATLPIADAPTGEIVRLMTGEAQDVPHKRRGTSSPGRVALTVRGLSTADKLKDVDLELRQGEIVGLAGVLGSGRTELLRALYGLDPVSRGRVEVYGQAIERRTPRKMLRLGMGLAPEDRKREGLVLDMGIAQNLVMSSMRKVVWRGLISRHRESQLAQQSASRMSVKLAGLSDPVRSLSGGNQQKVILGRCINADVKIFLLDEPTRGVDIAAKRHIYELLKELAAQGIAVLVASSELEELMLCCDRLLVMKDGAIVGEREVSDTDVNDVMAIAMGGAERTMDETDKETT